ncbi:unnamed protein product, partial [Anisakis simplex]|uniref:Chromodomain-helicase-DNA-binding protein 1-like (inferred by orthology to a human protein) n=1 Tax=Anisakis simplex TaxID=6269 RepID=A0A0M3KEQ8_ANISI
MYVFEGHDYKKEREALLKIVAENDKDNKELAGISVQNGDIRMEFSIRYESHLAARIRNVLHLKQGIKEEDDGETKQSESARRLEEVKIERARKAAERKAKFWADNGVFGNGGVFSALRKKDSRIPEAYELAAKMNDLYLGHAHLIANVETTTAQQNNELNGGKNAKSWTRRQSVVLLVVQQKKFRIFTNERLFAESLQRLCAYATRVNARSVHFPLLDNQMPGKNWYSVKRLIKKHLTDKRIHTYFYYYRRPTPPAKPQQGVNQKHQDRERKQQHSRDKRQNNRGNSNKVDGSHLEDRRRKDGRKRRMNSSEYDGGEGTSKNYTTKKRNEMRRRCKDNDDDDDDESKVIDRELDAQEGDEFEEIVDSEE